MIVKLVIASLLAGTSAASAGQDAPRTADGAASPSMHPRAGQQFRKKASMVDFHFTSRNAMSVGWSCSVSGSEEAPVFSVGLLVPTILGQAERASWGVGRGILPMSMNGAAPDDRTRRSTNRPPGAA